MASTMRTCKSHFWHSFTANVTDTSGHSIYAQVTAKRLTHEQKVECGRTLGWVEAFEGFRLDSASNNITSKNFKKMRATAEGDARDVIRATQIITCLLYKTL